MPYTMLVSQSEADLLHEAGVIEDAHCLVTFDPGDIMGILEKAGDKAEPDDLALGRLTTRLGTLMGERIVQSSATDEGAQAHQSGVAVEPAAEPAPEKSEDVPSHEASHDG